MPGELDYSSQDKEDAKQIMEWLQKTHQSPETPISQVIREAPRMIESALTRLTFRHMDITVLDVMDTMKRVMDA